MHRCKFSCKISTGSELHMQCKQFTLGTSDIWLLSLSEFYPKQILPTVMLACLLVLVLEHPLVSNFLLWSWWFWGSFAEFWGFFVWYIILFTCCPRAWCKRHHASYCVSVWPVWTRPLAFPLLMWSAVNLSALWWCAFWSRGFFIGSRFSVHGGVKLFQQLLVQGRSVPSWFLRCSWPFNMHLINNHYTIVNYYTSFVCVCKKTLTTSCSQ